MSKNELLDSIRIRNEAIDLILNTLYEKSNTERLHSKRVSKICGKIASEMDFNNEKSNQMKVSGMIHDIGKIGIDTNILNKPGKLDPDERNEIERHCEIGYRILHSVDDFSEIAGFVREHHERWDGKGYPMKLKGEGISIQARIIAVADSFDAMTSERLYTEAYSEQEAIDEIIKCSGSQFDPDIARVFVEKVLGKKWCEKHLK
jgi:putative nucleotidyltransferase with HDIG domain